MQLILVDESLLHWMELITRRKAFYSGDLPPVDLCDHCQAGRNG
ncbi:hypothetical protein [Rhizobium leguminosarum]|nr:hypothetical protein [Rhizobium leguminosarum]